MQKKLKRSKIRDHGLNFQEAQLIIISKYWRKNKLGLVKRNLRYITNKLYDNRDWTYNMACRDYTYGVKTVRGTDKSSANGNLSQTVSFHKETLNYSN